MSEWESGQEADTKRLGSNGRTPRAEYLHPLLEARVLIGATVRSWAGVNWAALGWAKLEADGGHIGVIPAARGRSLPLERKKDQQER